VELQVENEIKFLKTAESGVRPWLKHLRSWLPTLWWNHRLPPDLIFHYELCIEVQNLLEVRTTILQSLKLSLWTYIAKLI